jgi:hypothetical protein
MPLAVLAAVLFLRFPALRASRRIPYVNLNLPEEFAVMYARVAGKMRQPGWTVSAIRARGKSSAQR